jgi:hypothetical protein
VFTVLGGLWTLQVMIQSITGSPKILFADFQVAQTKLRNFYRRQTKNSVNKYFSLIILHLVIILQILFDKAVLQLLLIRHWGE